MIRPAFFSPSSRLRGAAAWLALAAIWTPVLWRLARMWRSEPEQYFGFGVPLLVGWLLWRRRAEWAVPGAPARGFALAAGGAGLGCLALGLLALEANPLWPTAAWMSAVGAVALTLAAIARGHGWRGVRAGAPVLALMLTALKWPAMVHEPAMQAMMQANARIAAELVSLAGAPAVVTGSVIEVGRGLVGVDEACSGLRSLQTVVMMALVLGEIGRLGWRRRAGLLAGASASALAFNIARTTVLTWVFARRGPEIEERWHDPVGAVALGLTLAAVWWLAEALTPRDAAEEDAKAMAENTRASSRPAAWRPFAAALAGVLAVEAGAQAWYLAHAPVGGERVSWRLEPPSNAGWRDVEVPRRAAEMLGYAGHESFGRETDGPRARQFLAFAFRWDADLARLGAAELHNPLVCLPAAGAVRERELPAARVTVGGVEVPFRFIRFRQGDAVQHVWFSLWSTRPGGAGAAVSGGDPARLRWRRVREGVRGDEREQLIFFVQGEETDAGAEIALRDAATSLLKRN